MTSRSASTSASGPMSISALPAFRIHAPINRPDYYDEVCVFLGASYFRAVAKGEIYGLSARGLVDQHRRSQGRGISRCSRRSGSRSRRRMPPRSSSMPCSTAKARRQPIASPSGPARPRCSTSRWRSIRASISQHAGLAPMTSMFFFGPNDRKDVDDFRPAVHDSDGLAIFNGSGEELWRPLSNPRDLQISTFRRPQSARLRPDAAGEELHRLSGSRIQLRDAAQVCGSSRSAIGAKARSCCSRFRPRRKFTTTSPRSGGRSCLCRPRANTPTPIGCTGGRMRRSRHRWRDSPEPAIGARGDDSKLFVLDLIGDKLKCDRSEEHQRRGHRRKGRDQEHRHPAQSGDRRLATELRTAVKDKAPSNCARR